MHTLTWLVSRGNVDGTAFLGRPKLHGVLDPAAKRPASGIHTKEPKNDEVARKSGAPPAERSGKNRRHSGRRMILTRQVSATYTKRFERQSPLRQPRCVLEFYPLAYFVAPVHVVAPLLPPFLTLSLSLFSFSFLPCSLSFPHAYREFYYAEKVSPE